MALRTQKIPRTHPQRSELLQTRILQISALLSRAKVRNARYEDACDATEVMQAYGIPAHADNRSGLVSVTLFMGPKKAQEIVGGLATFLKQHDLLHTTTNEPPAPSLQEDPPSKP